jgi:hypothetical protein
VNFTPAADPCLYALISPHTCFEHRAAAPRYASNRVPALVRASVPASSDRDTCTVGCGSSLANQIGGTPAEAACRACGNPPPGVQDFHNRWDPALYGCSPLRRPARWLAASASAIGGMRTQIRVRLAHDAWLPSRSWQSSARSGKREERTSPEFTCAAGSIRTPPWMTFRSWRSRRRARQSLAESPQFRARGWAADRRQLRATPHR